MQTCHETTVAGFLVKLEQRADLTFRLTYGEQFWDHLDYRQAAARLGEALMHALACEGKLDPR